MTPLQIAMMGRVAPRVSNDPDADAWAAAVTLAGGTYTATHLSAVSARITSAKAHGYWSKLRIFNPLAGSDLAAAKIQYASGSWAPATFQNFVSGDYSSSTGLTGNGTTKYIKTGVLASAESVTSHGLGLYFRTNSASLLVNGAQNSASRRTYLFTTGGSLFLDSPNDGVGGGANGRVSGAIAATTGFLCGNRTAANSEKVWRNGASVATNTATATGTITDQEIYFMAGNNLGTPEGFSTLATASYYYSSGMTDTEMADNYTDEQAFQTALSRQV